MSEGLRKRDRHSPPQSSNGELLENFTQDARISRLHCLCTYSKEAKKSSCHDCCWRWIGFSTSYTVMFDDCCFSVPVLILLP